MEKKLSSKYIHMYMSISCVFIRLTGKALKLFPFALVMLFTVLFYLCLKMLSVTLSVNGREVMCQTDQSYQAISGNNFYAPGRLFFWNVSALMSFCRKEIKQK
ncbi:hypothetical protein N5T04_27290 [Escherichia coli]|uniref:hypothetical protein n=1 Tax=Escherichia coli TaxID=562 RepID=UPI002225E405|nr:hypothetical protein [Escherichia coli]MCW3377939.1 hypothetical protein [Escherichia coli]